MQEQQLFSGDLVGAHLSVWWRRRKGWSVRVIRTYEYMGAGAAPSELYEELSRGELLDVLDALREQLSIGPEY
jgi:hypothetical protein